MTEFKYLIFFMTLIVGVPLGYLCCLRSKSCEKLVFFLVIFFTCDMLDINFVSIETYRGTTRGFEFGMVDISLYILLALVIKRRHRLPIDWFPIGSTLYLLYFSLSLLSTINSDIGIYSSFEILKMCRMYIYFWTIANYLRNEQQLHWLMINIGIIIFYIFLSVMKQKYLLGVFQCTGPFSHQNSLVMYISIFGAMAHAYLLNVAGSRSWLWFTIFGMASICILATLSRAGLALFILNSLMVFTISMMSKQSDTKVRKRHLILLIILPIAGTLVLIKASDTIIERFISAPVESKLSRVQLAKAAVNMANDKVLGVGLNNFALKINPPYPYSAHIPMYDKDDPDETHGLVETVYLMVAAETGWLNLAVFITFLLFFYFKNIINYFRFKGSQSRFICIALIAALTCIYLQSTLEWVLKQTNNFYQLMLVFAVIATMDRMTRTGVTNGQAKRKRC
ncbi:O-antigen ligase family protein [Shewanella violacea]|uniref:O-antigen ligase-related domain-containing protein n=1 Tax=Shewanella violacea (strain JCM 10179 / CIP 106290 / LMG 19151 / DSS12) TaxID=637905 RepID=D4ZIM7_SHEVD|nr:O-antigen ligase family protein [Shewanella violacea]BAJ01526.1 hypothetical protein SVI_1555 [Shewanella violacea DSS12]